MKFSFVRSFLRSRYPLAIAAGLMWAASFPNIGIAGFAWIAPGLMLAVALGKSGRESFRLGYVAGLAHYLVSLSWLLRIPDSGFYPLLGWVALSAFIALYPATWVWLCASVLCPKPANPRAGTESPGNFQGIVAGVLEPGWARRASWALTCAATWVALEMMIARFLGGFPWNLLGGSQFQITPLIQIASVTGIYGVTFLAVWTSVSLVCAVAAIIGQPHMRSIWMREVFLPLATITGVFVFGFHQLSQAPTPTRELKATLIQPSIPQSAIWDPANDADRFRQLLALSEQALTNETDVLFWPEAAIPKPLQWDKEIFLAVSGLASSHRVWMIVGSDDLAFREGSNDPKDADYFNSSFLVSPNGKLAAQYKKRSLVIFGEYIPFEHTLPFIKWFTPVTGSFTPGDRPVQFVMPDLQAKAAVLICFEDVFPHLAREYAEPDTDFLVNLTNDGWFGEGSAQWQQAAAAVFRAVENGLPLVRCSNNGLTCWIDGNGRIRKVFFDDDGTIHGPGYMTAKIPLLPAGEKRTPTFYTQHGDAFGWGCVIFVGLTLIRTIAFRRRSL